MTDAPARDRPYVFVSYASVDRERFLSLVGEVRESEIPAWVDLADITGGVSYGPEITSGIKESAALVLMCSAASLASRNVRQEIQLARRRATTATPRHGQRASNGPKQTLCCQVVVGPVPTTIDHGPNPSGGGALRPGRGAAGSSHSP